MAATLVFAANVPMTAQEEEGESIDTLITDTVAYEPHRRFDYFFLEAVRELNASHHDKAYKLLQYCLNLNPNAAEVHFLLTKYYQTQKNDSLALVSIAKAAELRPENNSYLELLAMHYISNRKYDEAIAAYEKLYANDKENDEALDLLLKLYQYKKDFANMLKTIKRVEERNGSDEETTLTKVRIYEMMDNPKEALQALKSLAAEHPYDLNYQLMVGNWLMQNNKEKEAYKIFAKALQEEPDNTLAQASMYDYYVAQQEGEKAEAMMEQMLVSSKTDSKTKANLLKQVIQESLSARRDSTELLNLFDKIVKANPKDGDMAEMRLAYMNHIGLPDSVRRAAMKELLVIMPDNAPVRIQLIQERWKAKDWDGIIALSEEAQAYNPEEMAFYYFMGLAHYQKEEKDKALAAFQRGVDEINENSNKDFVSDFYSIMGNILHEKGKKKEAFEAFDSCLQWKPDNLECLNNYAYFLSLTGEQLGKAEQMSYQTVKAEPTNATYLDTYAWILFMQERYAEAQIYIDQALAHDTDTTLSAEVLEHAGDIYAMNGNTEKALEYWQQALHNESTSAMLAEKIRLKKYIKTKK